MKKKVLNDSVMVTYEFGAPVYINASGQITYEKSEAEQWHSEYDQTKLSYYRSTTDFKQLKFESIK